MDSYAKKIHSAYTYLDSSNYDDINGGNERSTEQQYNHEKFMSYCADAIIDYINSSTNGIDIATYDGGDDDDDMIVAADELIDDDPKKDDEKAISEVFKQVNNNIQKDDDPEKNVSKIIKDIEDRMDNIEDDQIDTIFEQLDKDPNYEKETIIEDTPTGSLSITSFIRKKSN